MPGYKKGSLKGNQRIRNIDLPWNSLHPYSINSTWEVSQDILLLVPYFQSQPKLQLLDVNTRSSTSFKDQFQFASKMPYLEGCYPGLICLRNNSKELK